MSAVWSQSCSLPHELGLCFEAKTFRSQIPLLSFQLWNVTNMDPSTCSFFFFFLCSAAFMIKDSWMHCMTHIFPFLHPWGDIFCSFHCPCSVDLPIDFVHKIPCGALRSWEFPYGVLLFSLFCFLLGLHKVVKMKAPGRTTSLPSICNKCTWVFYVRWL